MEVFGEREGGHAKKLAILHANDIHGQLNFTVGKDLMVQGGISLLSGYVKKVREEEPVFFGICGKRA